MVVNVASGLVIIQLGCRKKKLRNERGKFLECGLHIDVYCVFFKCARGIKDFVVLRNEFVIVDASVSG